MLGILFDLSVFKKCLIKMLCIFSQEQGHQIMFHNMATLVGKVYNYVGTKSKEGTTST